MISHHACDVCGADGPLPLPQDPRISVCGNCGFVYVAERRSPEEIAAAWTEVYRSGGYDPNSPAVKTRLYFVAEWIDQTFGLQGKRLLDVGAGQGGFMDLATLAYGADCEGLEPVGELGDDVRVTHASVETARIVGQYDLVTILWTLENCGDCIGMLKFARNHSAPGGRVVVATGSRILVPFKKPLSSYLNPNMRADLHCFRWSAETLREAAAVVGLRLVAVNPYREQDWLVISFADEPDEPWKIGKRDDPAAVLRHFADWERMFP